MRYFQAQNANRIIAGIAFDITDIVGSSAWGVYATDDEALIAKLDALTKDPASAVTEIDEATYNLEQENKKKLAGYPSWTESRAKPQPERVALKSLPAGPAVVIEDHEPAEGDKPVEISEGASSVEEALGTAKVVTDAPEELPAQQRAPSKKKPSKSL